MGMNYYLQWKISDNQKKALDEVKATLPQLHIGKSSWGWQFLFRGYCFDYETDTVLREPKAVMSFDDWKGLFRDCGYEIVDEDGEVVSSESFQLVVDTRAEGKRHGRLCHHEDSKGYEFLTSEFS